MSASCVIRNRTIGIDVSPVKSRAVLKVDSAAAVDQRQIFGEDRRLGEDHRARSSSSRDKSAGPSAPQCQRRVVDTNTTSGQGGKAQHGGLLEKER